MVIVWILVAATTLYLLQELVYRHFWNKGVVTSVGFAGDAVFEDEKGILEEVVYNAKALPIIAMKVKFQTSRNLKFLDSTNTIVTDLYYRNDIISVMPYRKLTRKLEFIGKKRGFYAITHMTVVGTDLFMSSQMVDEKECYTAIYVYPKPYHELDWLETLQKMNGEILDKRHIVEDPFEFRGIRQYEPYDDMRSINWKASAKVDDFMVNQRNCTVAKTVRVLCFLKNSTMIRREELLETSIRIVASLAENYITKGVRLTIFSNCHDMESGQIFSMAESLGAGYLENLYKSLARLDTTKIDPFETGLLQTLQSDYESITILVSPYENADLQTVLEEYVQKNDSFYWVCPRKKDADAVISDALQKYFLPVIVEGNE